MLILHLTTHTARRIIAAALLQPAASPQLAPGSREHLGTPQPPRCVDRLGHLAATSTHGGRGGSLPLSLPRDRFAVFPHFS